MGRILNSKGEVQYDAKGKAVSNLAKNKGVTTSAVPSYDSFEDFQNANPQAAGFASKIAGGFGLNLADPAASRLGGAGISKGANPFKAAKAAASSNPAAGTAEMDHRVRISLPYNSKLLYKDSYIPSLLRPLVATNGVVFPFTPNIIFNQNADYTRVAPTHSNYPLNFYNSSAVSDITVFGQFVAQDGADASYVMAVITFLRAVTKMYAGMDSLAGNPPPVLRLSGHGQYMLPSVPCVVTNVSITLPADIDYITIPTPGAPTAGNYAPPGAPATTRVPKRTEISVNLTPVYSREALKSFSVDKLADGRAISKFYGGFI